MENPHPTLFTIEDIKQALTKTLPGVSGQVKMAPAPVDGQVNRWHPPQNCQEAAVLLLLYPHTPSGGTNSELHITLMRRPEYTGAHSGQISLPGGRREAGESLKTTALREATEEVGVMPHNLQVVGQLSALYTPPSNFCIYPFVAFSPIRPTFEVDPREVAELIETPLSVLVNSALHKEEIWHFEKYGNRRVPYFDVFGHKVWGATAMILSEFFTLLRQEAA